MEIILKPLSWLKPYLRNPRYNDGAVDAVKASIREFGFRNPILAEPDGTIIAGHTRWKAALALELKEAPVIICDDLAAEKIRALRLADNKTAELAEWDTEKLLAEFAELPGVEWEQFGFSKEEMEAWQEGPIEKTENNEDDFLDIEDEPGDIFSYSLNVMFKSSNFLSIPDLRKDMLAYCPSPIETWAGKNIQYQHNNYFLYNWRSDSIDGLNLEKTVIAFYVDDNRFEPVWDHPDIYIKKMINRKIKIGISPNFSLWYGRPYAEQIWNTYRARWIGRYMQEAGIKLIPDVNFSDENSFEFCFLGIPENPPCISFQIQTIKGDEEMQRCKNGILTAIDKIKPESILLYGNETMIDWAMEFMPSINIYPLMNRSHYRRTVIKEQW